MGDVDRASEPAIRWNIEHGSKDFTFDRSIILERKKGKENSMIRDLKEYCMYKRERKRN